MARTPSTTMQAFMAERAQSQYGFAVGELPNLYGLSNGTPPGTISASQLLFPNVLTYRISRSQDQSSDTCTLTFADDTAQYLSTNKTKANGSGYMFYPGPIDKKMSLYLGYKGPINSGKAGFVPFTTEAIACFTGFIETDANAQGFASLDKTVTINDLTSQFKFQVYDTFPHALFGNQTLNYFDPAYNLYPIANPNNNNQVDGVVWQCDGRMFTTDSNDPVWGSTNMPVLVFVDTTGDTPQKDALGGSTNYVTAPTFPSHVGQDQDGYFSFDFSNGIVTFTSSGLSKLGYPGGLPLTSAVSLQGNPTYMAPETMIYKLLVEKAGWNSDALDLQTTNLLMPMFDGQDRSIWDCLNAICGMCAPRFLPWKLWCDESGVIHFYELNLDSPPKRYWVNGHGIVTANHEYTARDVRTVVRGDGTVAIAGTGSGSGSDQSITAIAYDNRAIAEYGLTEPLLLSSDVTDSVEHLSPTQAVAHLNLIATAQLYESSRPTYTITCDMMPDYYVQIADKVHYTDDSIGVDDEFQITALELSSDGKKASMQVTLEQYYETVNMNLGVPSGVSYSEESHAATQSPPNSAIIRTVRLGNNHPLYVYRYGDYTRDANNNPIVANWDATYFADAMHFDFELSSKSQSMGTHNEWSYKNLPPVTGGTWEGEVYKPTGDIVYYIPKADGPGGDGYTYCVGPDNIFYRYSNGPPKNDPPNGGNSDYHLGPPDLTYVWIPPGNSDPGPTGKGYDVYVWAWWYLCLDSNINDPKTGHPYWTEPFKEKDGRLLMRFTNSHNNGNGGTNNNIDTVDGKKLTVNNNSSFWLYNKWMDANNNVLYPGPYYGIADATKLYKNLVIGCTDYTTPPPGFIGSNVMQDGVNVGVAYGNNAPSTALYVNYQKRTKGHFCIYAMSNDGGSQFLRFPFWLIL